MTSKNSPYSIFSILISMLIMLWVSSNINWGKDNWKGMLESDAKGYYAYLPAVFIYQDLNFGFLDDIQEKYPAPHLDYDYRANANGVLINKYFAGTAVMQLPFFASAHLVSKLSGEDADGYSKWYMIAVNVAALFYLTLGLIFLRKSLLHFKVPEQWTALLLFACLFGSNLFVYSAVEPGMSHVFSFSLISFWVYQALQFKQQGRLKQLLTLILILGLIILIRPVNALVVFALPFIAGNSAQFKQYFSPFLNKPKLILPAIVLFIIFPFLQLLYYKFATGHWLVYSYDQETFDFSSPHIFEILFSYKKGLFLYTPIYFLAFAGLIPLWKINSFKFWTWLGFFALITYVFSSWWMWFYGGSFSSRVYVEYLPLFMILLGFAFRHQIGNWKEYTLGVAVVLLIALCQVQSYQYRYYIIHYSEMTKEKYWENFLKLEKK